MKSGIYKITNKLNGKFYIGQSRRMSARWKKHCCPSAANRNMPIARAIQAYGKENFKFEVLEFCSIAELNAKEIEYIRKLNPKYNITAGGEGSNGHKVSKKSREILRAHAKRQWAGYTEEEKKRRLLNLTGPRKGHPVSEETRQKIRAAATLQRLTKEQSELRRKKCSEHLKRLHAERPYLRSRAVAMLDPHTGNVLKIFPTAKEAGSSIGRHPSTVTGVCKGRKKTAGGFGWRYAQ